MQPIAPISPGDRRAAEERLRARHEAELMRTPEKSTTGALVEAVELNGTYPKTTLVVVFRHQLRPGCRFAWHWPLWLPSTIDLPEPLYDEHMRVYLMEWIHKDLKRHLDCPDGETVHVGILEPAAELPPADATE